MRSFRIDGLAFLVLSRAETHAIVGMNSKPTELPEPRLAADLVSLEDPTVAFQCFAEATGLACRSVVPLPELALRKFLWRCLRL